ncbi:MAG: PTS sugar transporter subunit IIA [Armatimonadetes bacterium]|nr:PTS sugar transporter subunit IIA [Akkermansiaceae bacterium]
MKLAKLLDLDRILLEVKATEHWPVIEELVDFLAEKGDIPKVCRQDILAALKEREAQISTGIGSGLAIPHTFSDTMQEVVAVFGRSKAGIDFGALDKAPAHFIILFIVPRKDYHLHLQTLSAIAKMFTNGEVRRKLAAAVTREEIVDILDPKPLRFSAGNAESC